MNHSDTHASNETVQSPQDLQSSLAPQDPALLEVNGTAIIATSVQRYHLNVRSSLTLFGAASDVIVPTVEPDNRKSVDPRHLRPVALILPQLSVGFGISIVLLLLAFALSRQPSASDDPSQTRNLIQSAGVLQLTWLLGNEPHIAKVKEPELRSLRMAGMFDIQMSERSHR